MSVSMKKSFSTEMQNLDAAGLLRTETPVVQAGNMQVRFGGNKGSLNFIGNDLLGWTENDIIREAAKEALTKYGTGSTSSRASIGTLDIYMELEEKLSRYLGVDDCIVFPSNYLANIGLFEPLTNDRDTIFIDEKCNPGLFDGTRLSEANVVSYKHKDIEDLEYHLKCSQNSRYRIVVTDAVFNSSGDCANLSRIQQLTQIYDAISVVDDGLGVGILGKNGQGTFSHQGLEKKSELVSGTFAYALGNVSGGFIGGDKELVKWLRYASRSYILSEPISPINAVIVLKAIEILEEDQSALERLYSNSTYAKTKMIKKAWKPIHNDYPFVSISVGSTLNAQKMVEYLFEKNILVSGLCYPNTPEGASLLRFNISANHTEKQIDTLVDSIEEAFGQLK